MLIKFRIPEIVLGVLFAVAIFAMGMLFQSSLPSPNQQAAQGGNHSAENRPPKIAGPDSPDERIANYTWWLSAFTLALVAVSGFQIFFLTRADKTARITAEAAMLSAKAAVRIALPQFVLTRITWPTVNDRLGLTLGTEKPDVTLKNYGRSVAVVTSQCLVVRPAVALPPNPDYPPESIQAVDFGQAVDTGDGHQIVGTTKLTSEQIDAIIGKRETLWLYGYIEYRSFLGTRYCSGFCSALRLGEWPRISRDLEFIQAGPDSYTYNKELDDSPSNHADTTA